MLSAGQLAQLQRLTEQGMRDSVTLLTPDDPVSDGRGGFTQAFSDGETVDCRVRPYTERADAIEGGQPGNQELWLFVLPLDTEIDTNYRLRRNDIDYEVVGTPTDSSWQISKKVLARKVSNE